MTAQPTVVDQYFLVKIHGICPKLSKFDENWSNFIKLGQKLSIFIKKEKKIFLNFFEILTPKLRKWWKFGKVMTLNCTRIKNKLNATNPRSIRGLEAEKMPILCEKVDFGHFWPLYRPHSHNVTTYRKTNGGLQH